MEEEDGQEQGVGAGRVTGSGSCPQTAGVAGPMEGLIVEVPPGLLESFLPAGGTLSVQH